MRRNRNPNKRHKRRRVLTLGQALDGAIRDHVEDQGLMYEVEDLVSVETEERVTALKDLREQVKGLTNRLTLIEKLLARKKS